MSPDVYPSKEHFEKVISKLDRYDQISILEYLRGETSQASADREYFLIFGVIIGYVLGCL